MYLQNDFVTIWQINRVVGLTVLKIKRAKSCKWIKIVFYDNVSCRLARDLTPRCITIVLLNRGRLIRLDERKADGSITVEKVS